MRAWGRMGAHRQGGMVAGLRLGAPLRCAKGGGRQPPGLLAYLTTPLLRKIGKTVFSWVGASQGVLRSYVSEMVAEVTLGEKVSLTVLEGLEWALSVPSRSSG